jgi:ATP/maltotriose-dependent transcriptional regulator MalT
MVTLRNGPDPVVAGQEALQVAAWADARACFEAAAADGDAPEAWEGLSRAAWWQGDEPATLAARERAHHAYAAAGDAHGAARMAMWLASDHLDFRGDDAVASAWLTRGRALLRDREPCPELGYILLLDADISLLSRSDPAAAERSAREALDLARDVGDVGVEVVALAVLGSALVAAGEVAEGLRRLEECAAMAVGETFTETAAPGWALCHTVSACADLGDFGRAAQWCRALHSWSALWQARHFFGVCRTAYGEVLATSGDWSSAEQELLSAWDDLRATRPALAAPTAVRLGRLRLRQGDLAEARALFEAALPQAQALVALGELDLAAGDASAAADAADRVLRRPGEASLLDRFPALELRARARAASGDHLGAEVTTAELEREADRLATPYMRARARLVRARVRSAVGDHDGARRAAEDAVDLFDDCAAPYEGAEARLVLSGALEALGRSGRAEAEARAARAVFELLGAGGNGRRGGRQQLTPREADILRLVARGLGDAQIADRLFLSPHTVHRHVANIRTKLGVPSRAAAVAHATQAGLLDP